MQVTQAQHTRRTSFLCVGDFAGQQEQAISGFRFAGYSNCVELSLAYAGSSRVLIEIFKNRVMLCKEGHVVLSGLIVLHSYRLRRVL
jgi:hypothetical protein